MTKIAQIKTLNNSEEFINILSNKDLLVYEDVQGAKVFVKWTGERFIIKPKSLRMDNLNFVDLTVQKFYNQAYLYFHSLPNYVTELLNKNWWFCFEYFPNDTQPANIKYNKLPKNNLILNSIIKGTKWVYEFNELVEYSNLFDVELLPIIFKGKLSNKQLEIIELYLNTKEEDLEYVFNDDNFAHFFYKLLNPKEENSFLMRKDNFNENLEKMIIKIDGKYDYSFEILNPMYRKMNIMNSSEHVEIYSLILLKFLEFCQLVDLDKYDLIRFTKDELYVEFISLIFNDFIENSGKNIKSWEFVIPHFFKQEKFKINADLLFNEDTKEHVSSDEKIEYVFKCVLGSFNKKRKKPIGIFTENTVNIFNKFVEDFDKILDKKLRINRDYMIQKDDLKNFKDYFNLKYNVDSQGELYPDVYSEFDDDIGGEKKKKKGFKGKDMKGFEPFKKGDEFSEDIFDKKY